MAAIGLVGSAATAAQASPQAQATVRQVTGAVQSQSQIAHRRAHRPLTHNSEAQAPRLKARGRSLTWKRVAGVNRYQLATILNPKTTHTASYRMVSGTSFRPQPISGRMVNYGLRTGISGSHWAHEVTIRWPASRATATKVPSKARQPASSHRGASRQPTAPIRRLTKLKVGINNATGWGPAVNTLFRNAGVPYERLDIGRGGGLSVLDAAISRGMKDLPAYASGNTGNLNDVTPAQVSSDISALAPQLASRGITALEFGNEVYNSISPTQYASLYNAAHIAAAGRIKLIAVATTDYYDQRIGGTGNWFADIKNALPGGTSEVDGWTIHPYGSLTSVCGDGYGWPMLGPLHTESMNAGFSANLPWYITEVGQEISGSGLECQAPVTQAQQATAMTQYLNDIKTQDPWVVWIDWYTSCDDSSGGFGLINKNTAGECGVTGTTVRPAFTAMANWITTNGQG